MLFSFCFRLYRFTGKNTAPNLRGASSLIAEAQSCYTTPIVTKSLAIEMELQNDGALRAFQDPQFLDSLLRDPAL